MVVFKYSKRKQNYKHGAWTLKNNNFIPYKYIFRYISTKKKAWIPLVSIFFLKWDYKTIGKKYPKIHSWILIYYYIIWFALLQKKRKYCLFYTLLLLFYFFTKQKIIIIISVDSTNIVIFQSLQIIKSKMIFHYNLYTKMKTPRIKVLRSNVKSMFNLNNVTCIFLSPITHLKRWKCYIVMLLLYYVMHFRTYVIMI